MNAIEPLSFWLNDGSERKFILTFAQIRQAATETGAVPSVNAAAFGTELLSRALYIAMLDKGEMKYEEFESLLPPDPDLLAGFYDALKNHCGMPQNDKYRPRKSQTPTQ